MFDGEYFVGPLQNILFDFTPLRALRSNPSGSVPGSPISAPALPAQWNALEVIFHRGGMQNLVL
jgi:hypothetical protein